MLFFFLTIESVIEPTESFSDLILTTTETLGRKLSGDLFLCTKEDNGTREIPKRCFKCENTAHKFNNNGLVTRPLKSSGLQFKLSFSDE